MIAKFLGLEWKQFFRSSYWQKGIAVNIILGFLALFMIIYFLAIGVGAYFIIKKELPEIDPLAYINSFLIYWVLGDLIFRYLMQKLPIMNIKPLLILPIKKTKLVHYVLGKSIFSFFNILSLFFFVPFAIVLIVEGGYNAVSILSWLFAMCCIVLTLNFLNFLINKNQKVFIAIATFLIATVLAYKLGWFNVNTLSSSIFNAIVSTPILAIIPLILALTGYYINFKFLQHQVYLDQAVQKKSTEANTAELGWLDKFGDVAPFIKNDIRLIWRNKRTKTVFMMSFLFLFYGLMFFTQEVYMENKTMLVLACVFITGGFTLNYGQFIPAWDSQHYRMLMSQNILYRKFLESKWYLMVVMTVVLFVLSTPYIYFGIEVYLLIVAGFIFNVGFTPLLMIFMGSYNRKRIDLNKSGFSNYQGTSAVQFLMFIPVIIFPMLVYAIFNYFFGFNVAIFAIAGVGISTLLLKNPIMNVIEKKYQENKYAVIHAFNQK